MNKKLTIADISDIVSSKSGITKKESEQFVKEFFTLATEVISKGESLTIKGVGTFVPVWVDARTSVDVNTKQPIEIPGHYKLSFTPDKIMRDAVNAPFAAFTTEVVDIVENDITIESETIKFVATDAEITSVQEEMEVAEPTINKLEEKLQLTNEELTVEFNNQSGEQATEQIDENIEENSIEEEKNDVLKIETTKVDDTQQNEIVISGEDIEDELDEKKLKKEYRRRTRNGYISGFITAFILFVIFIAVWIFIYNDGKGISFSFSNFKITSVEEQEDNNKPSNEIEEEQENNTETSIVELQTEQENNLDVTIDDEIEQTPEEKKFDEGEKIKKEPIIETIERGKFLTTIANKYYGDKVFWVYIYRENSDRIWNPKDLKAGFKVVVPDAVKYNIDASNPESIKRAKELEKQILYEIE